MKNILIITHTYSAGGGAERVLNTLVGELSQWYDIDIIERWEDNTLVYDLPKNVHKLKSMTYFPHMVDEMRWNKSYWNLQRKLLSVVTILFPGLVYRHFIKGHYDYEISFNYLYSALLIANSSNYLSKKIAWNHGDLFDLDFKQYKGFDYIINRIKSNIEKRALKKVDSVVAISQNTYKSIVQLFPFAEKKLELIYNGYDFKTMMDRSSENDVLASSRFRLIFLGRLDLNKNVLVQIKAVNKLIKEKRMDVELLIFGQGSEEGSLKAEAGDNIGNHIFFKGFTSNPYPYLKSSNALIMTSLSEGFPTVLVESLCLGTPVIATNVGGVSEIVQVGKNGLVVENDVNDIAEKIYYMATHYEQFTNHIEDTVSQFSAENWGRNVKKLLETL
jgi:glycosyltransferase involved in cell wall biosynthesis